jgi:hypothetical protein
MTPFTGFENNSPNAFCKSSTIISAHLPTVNRENNVTETIKIQRFLIIDDNVLHGVFNSF